MVIPIIVPVGRIQSVVLHGRFWKVVICEHCQQPYAYVMELTAKGSSPDLLYMDGKGSVERARSQAEENLARQREKSIPTVPCPCCGSYQKDMAQQMKEQAWINPLQIIGGIIALLSFIALAFDF